MQQPAERPQSVPRITWLTLFGVAMGFLEAAVVVYLRELYYPDGFRFPIVSIPPSMAIVEQVRELTTLLMLLAVAALSGRGGVDRFFVFAYLFGTWDIVYYLGLRIFLDWPASLLTWDLLFLIPVPWVAPVLYPVLVSVVLIGGFLFHEFLRRRRRPLSLRRSEWLVATVGSVLVVGSFCWEWRVVIESTIPTSFPVFVFGLGLVTGVVPFAVAGARALRRGPRAP